MRAEELLEKLSDEELMQKANGCFIQAENTALYQQAGPEERQRLLMEADLYLKALAWRHDERVSQRDLKLEIWVIILIGIEIALSVYGLWEGHQQGKLIDKQTTALTHMDTSTADTAKAMQAARDSLKSLADAQSQSLDRLTEMNDALQSSHVVTRKQLDILKKDQAEREAQLAKKPKLALFAGATSLLTAAGNTEIPPTEKTDTSISFDLTLTNQGDANATGMEFRVAIFSKDVTLDSPVPHEEIRESAGAAARGYILHIDHLRAGIHVLIPIKFLYSKGQPPFAVYFNIDGNEIPAGTPLGTLTVGTQIPKI
jgi:hypothetical protein